MIFHAKIELSGKSATGFQVPADVVTQLGSGKRPAVRVTINGHTYRSTVAPMGGVYMIPLSGENRALAKVSAGDEVEVELEPDTQPRDVSVPPDLQAVIERDADARRFFDGLSYSNKQRIVLSIEGAKSPETRQRRIAQAVSTLHEGRV
jgi:hypothetical protein